MTASELSQFKQDTVKYLEEEEGEVGFWRFQLIGELGINLRSSVQFSLFFAITFTHHYKIN